MCCVVFRFFWIWTNYLNNISFKSVLNKKIFFFCLYSYPPHLFSRFFFSKSKVVHKVQSAREEKKTFFFSFASFSRHRHRQLVLVLVCSMKVSSDLLLQKIKSYKVFKEILLIFSHTSNRQRTLKKIKLWKHSMLFKSIFFF